MRTTLRALWRAAGLRCPHCAARWPRHRAVAIAPRCPSCSIRLRRGEADYFLGAYTINLIWSLIAAVGIAVAAVLLPRRTPLVFALGIPLIVGLAIWLYPASQLMWLAADLQFRPVTGRDFETKR